MATPITPAGGQPGTLTQDQLKGLFQNPWPIHLDIKVLLGVATLILTAVGMFTGTPVPEAVYGIVAVLGGTQGLVDYKRAGAAGQLPALLQQIGAIQPGTSPVADTTPDGIRATVPVWLLALLIPASLALTGCSLFGRNALETTLAELGRTAAGAYIRSAVVDVVIPPSTLTGEQRAVLLMCSADPTPPHELACGLAAPGAALPPLSSVEVPPITVVQPGTGTAQASAAASGAATPTGQSAP
jgi:hypothetical protein